VSRIQGNSILLKRYFLGLSYLVRILLIQLEFLDLLVELYIFVLEFSDSLCNLRRPLLSIPRGCSLIRAVILLVHYFLELSIYSEGQA